MQPRPPRRLAGVLLPLLVLAIPVPAQEPAAAWARKLDAKLYHLISAGVTALSCRIVDPRITRLEADPEVQDAHIAIWFRWPEPEGKFVTVTGMPDKYREIAEAIEGHPRGLVMTLIPPPYTDRWRDHVLTARKRGGGGWILTVWRPSPAGSQTPSEGNGDRPSPKGPAGPPAGVAHTVLTLDREGVPVLTVEVDTDGTRYQASRAYELRDGKYLLATTRITHKTPTGDETTRIDFEYVQTSGCWVVSRYTISLFEGSGAPVADPDFPVTVEITDHRITRASAPTVSPAEE